MTTATITHPREANDAGRAKRLKALTHDVHDRLDRSIMAAAVFATLDGYSKFVRMQYLFHRDIEAFYGDPQLEAALPGLQERRRLPLIALDLADLGHEAPQTDNPPIFQVGEIDLPTALGWLYVAEGSNLGAAVLRMEVAKLGLSDLHGGRHLAPAPEGPAAHWRTFTARLDAVTLTPEEEARIAAGAKAAFARVEAHARVCFG